jgi:hypothetical protein
MLPKAKTHWWLGVSILSILLLATCLLTTTIFTMLQRGFKISDGSLGFVGAIVGGIIAGYITLKGVQKTIEVGNRDRFIESYNKQMKVIYAAQAKFKEILSMNAFILFSIQETDEKRDEIILQRMRFLKTFADDFNVEFQNLLGVVDWHVVHKIDLKSAGLNNIYYFEKLYVTPNPPIETILKAIDTIYGIAGSINKYLEEHKQFLISNYYKRIGEHD